jgi:hypothetical protein
MCGCNGGAKKAVVPKPRSNGGKGGIVQPRSKPGAPPKAVTVPK